MSEPQLPLSKLSAMKPVSDGLDLMGMDSQSIFDLYLGSPDHDADYDIPMRAIHNLMEACAQDIGDPYFGSNLATLVANQTMSFYGLNYADDLSLAEVLIKFVVVQREDFTSAPFQLTTSGNTSWIMQVRDSFTPEQTAQSDAWLITNILAFTQDIVGPAWDPKMVTISLFDPAIIPPETLPADSIKSWRKSGWKFNFPTDWLLLRRGSTPTSKIRKVDPPPSELTSSIRAALRPLIGKEPLTLDSAALHCGIQPRNLQTSLTKENITFNELLTSLKAEYAQEMLLNETVGITTIGEALGYSDRSAFSRAFKNWTGLSPNQFRKQQGHK